jgi:NADH-quinone oxidoreductase subunit C
MAIACACFARVPRYTLRVIAADSIRVKLLDLFPEAPVDFLPNEAPGAQPSLILPANQALQIFRFLRDDPGLQFDYLSNVTGVDYLDLTLKEKIKKKTVVDGVEKEVEETIEKMRPGFLEVVYHLYSVALKHGPLVVRMRTADRSANVTLPSVTPLWRSAEFQEREIFDLYGVRFEGHPDLRRILMWDAFKDFPMRKDYVEPDDYEYEPTPHDEVLEKAKAHYPKGVAA